MLGAVVSSSEWSSEAMSMRQPALALQLRGQRAAAPEQGGELRRSLCHRLPSSPRAHLSLDAPCQHAVPATPMSLADQQAARTHLQAVAPAKSHEHGDWADSAVAGQRARCRLCPRPCCLCRVSPSHALTDGIMFADNGRAWSPDVLGTDLRHRHPRKRCLGRHQGHRGGQRRRCAPPACDLGTGCWSAVSRARWLGSRAEPRMRAAHRLHSCATVLSRGSQHLWCWAELSGASGRIRGVLQLPRRPIGSNLCEDGSLVG